MKKQIIFTILLFCLTTGYIQILHPIHWSFALKRLNSEEYIILLKASMDDNWHIYSQRKNGDDGPVSTSIKFASVEGYKLIGETLEPAAITKFEPAFQSTVSFFQREVIFKQKIRLDKKVPVKGKISFMACNDQKCLPPEEVEFTIPTK